MKKDLIIMIIISTLSIILLTSFISAVEISMKNNYKQGETLIAKISGNFIEPISYKNIHFYRKHVEVPILFDIAKLEQNYYLYALLPEKKQNYSLRIENIRYYSGSQIIEDTIIKNFNVSEEKADFSVNLGFIKTKENFEITTQNLLPNPISINNEFNSKTENLSLNSGEIKTLFFDVSNIKETGLKYIKLSSQSQNYEIPAFIIKDIDTDTDTENITNDSLEYSDLRFIPAELTKNIFINHEIIDSVFLYNKGEKTIKNIVLSYPNNLNDIFNLEPISIDELKPNKKTEINLTFFSDKENIFESYLKAESDINNISIKLILKLNFLKSSQNLENITQDGQVVDEGKNCEQQDGAICSPSQECKGNILLIDDEECCIGTCVEQKSTPAFWKILGWIIIIIIVILLIWFYFSKFKKTKGSSIKDIFKKSEKKYRQN